METSQERPSSWSTLDDNILRYCIITKLHFAHTIYFCNNASTLSIWLIYMKVWIFGNGNLRNWQNFLLFSKLSSFLSKIKYFALVTIPCFVGAKWNSPANVETKPKVFSLVYIVGDITEKHKRSYYEGILK